MIGTARADLIIYTETALVSGSIAGTPFSPTLDAISATADTVTVLVGPSSTVTDQSAKITINNVDYTITGTTHTNSIPQSFIVGIGPNLGLPGPFLDTSNPNPPVGSYNLTTAIGPLNGHNQFATGGMDPHARW
jgi:hypothetical protein